MLARDLYTHRFSNSERLIFKRHEKMTVSEWAETYRYVETGPKKGRWTNTMTPYLVEPMNSWNDPHIRKIILRFAPQTGKTQVAFNCLCYAIDRDPAQAMYVMPDEKTARRISTRRLMPMFRSSPIIRDLMSDNPNDTTSLAAYFKNGMGLLMAWATSAAELASESVRYLIMDEVDKFPEFSGKEADPLSLAEIRTNAYPHTKKILYLSTPTTEEGYITRAVNEEADEVRQYHVPCPICGAWQKMEFENILWPKNCRDPRVVMRKRLAEYSCVECGMLWNDHMRDLAVKAGVWKSDNPVERPIAVAYTLPSWYSPFVSLSSVAAAFLRGQEGPHKLYIFVTQHQAAPWKETIETKEESAVMINKTEIPSGIVPKDAIALTCGIDAQKSGFWFVVRAWAADLTSWLIQYGYLSSWKDLETLLFETHYPVMDSNRKMDIIRAALDTGGSDSEDNEWSRTEEIYTWLRTNGRNRVHGIKGASRPQFRRVEIRILDKMKRGNRIIPGGLELRFLDTAQFKEILHWRLGRKEGESQRLLLHSETGLDYARQFLAEEKRRDRRNKIYWKKIRRDNHLLDCEVYAAACADPQWTPSIQYIEKVRATEKPVRRRIISKGL